MTSQKASLEKIAVGRPGPEFIPDLPLHSLIESDLNPRKRFAQAALDELESSIREKGVLTPLLARPIVGGDLYEIAAGHRRRRAALAAGLNTVPVLVRSMTDAEFLEVLVIENDQREDVHPLEEAAGYQALAASAGYDVPRIAARVGRSVKYVYDRMKLLQLVPEAQKLFLEDRFTAGHAILLARLPAGKQKEAVEFGEFEAPPIFTDERGLFDPRELFDDGDEKDRDPFLNLKPISVRELQAWIDMNIKADRELVDPVLFPETAEMLDAARDSGVKVIPIMHLGQTPQPARDGEKILAASSWMRADGLEGSKACDEAEVGIVTIGPGRYEAFPMCRKKDRCLVHWAENVKAKQAREKAGDKAAAGGGDRKQAERDKEIEQERLRKAEQAKAQELAARWKKAQPALLAAVAAAVKKAPVGAGGALGQLIIAGADREYPPARAKVAKVLPPGKSAEDLVRFAGLVILAHRASSWNAMTEFPKVAKALGVDAWAVVNKAVPPVQTSAPNGKGGRGTCRKCSCTVDKPCASGCGWADATETRCTACFPPTLKSRAKKKSRK